MTIVGTKPQHLNILRDYAQDVARTDKLAFDDLWPIHQGLFGEVGSVMAIVKKSYREREYANYQRAAMDEELGDVLWYFAALCRRLNIGVDAVAPRNIKSKKNDSVPLAEMLCGLGKAAAKLLTVDSLDKRTLTSLRLFMNCYLQVLQVSGADLWTIVQMNAKKTRGRFSTPDIASLPTFDDDFPAEERLPSHFEIRVMQRKSGLSQLQWNEVFIGDPLSDSIRDHDGYRFHDVFHLAHAAILHWSPTFRGLIKHKRKSEPAVDEAQDGGRAIVVEEGLTAWIFSRAKQVELFAGQRTLPFDMLKTVEQFVQGYEVEECPLSLWERAILDGYEVFRQVVTNNGGIVIGDRATRSISYRID